MKTRIIVRETKETIGTPELKIIPRIKEKIYHNDILYSVLDIIHSPDKITIFVFRPKVT